MHSIRLFKTRMVLAVAVFSLILMAFPLKSHAEGKVGAAAPACQGLKIATGPSGKGYSKSFSDLKAVCGQQVPLCEVLSEGGLDNLTKLSTNEADAGFAGVDAVLDMRNGDDNIASLQQVASLNYNYLHVVVSTTGFTVDSGRKWYGAKNIKQFQINKFSDLRNMPVAVVGSVSLLARKVDRALGLNMVFIDADNDAAAFNMVKTGQVAAAMSISGWPSGTVSTLKQSDNLTLVPFDVTISAPYVVKPLPSYKGIGVYNVNALATPNVLLTRPFKGQKANDISMLQHCLAKSLSDLQEGSYTPIWKEIKNLDSTYDVPKFRGAQSSSIDMLVPVKRK